MTNTFKQDEKEIAASQNVKERDYWLKKLSDFHEKSIFPYDFNEKNKLGTTRTIDIKITDNAYSAIAKLSNASDYRLFMILVALLNVLLYKYSGSGDIVLAVPIYRQKFEGNFINTVLPLRIEFNSTDTFKEILLKVRKNLQEAVENQNYPLEALLYRMNLNANGKENPLLDMGILLENIHDRKYIEHLPLNLIFTFNHTGHSIEGNLHYNTSLYRESTLLQILNHFQLIMEELPGILNSSAARIEILSKQEKRQLLMDFNDTQFEFPPSEPLHRLFEKKVEKNALPIAVVFEDHAITYQKLNEMSNQMAHLLKSKGVIPNRIVAVLAPPSPELIIAILAIIKAGGAYLPLDTDYPERRILSILNDSGTLILLTKQKPVSKKSFTALENISTHKKTPIIKNPFREPIKDFDTLAHPDRTLVNYNKYHQHIGIAMAKHTVSLQATRGCPFNCAYCHKIWPKKHITRSAQNIFAEMKKCYDAGVKRFVFVDDVFNLNQKNAMQLFRKILVNKWEVQLFFPNGLRGDILSKESIDLMVEAGTVNMDLALESASPRIQRLIGKNLNLEKFTENAHYIMQKYPHVLLEMELMFGFPSETEEEAIMTLEFLENLKWVHFPNLNILKIYPNTDMYRLAIENGISPEQIERSANLAYHELPETLPFSKTFTGQYQMRFMNKYFLSKERLLHVLPHQAKSLTKDELISKYDTYLPMKIESIADILKAAEIKENNWVEPNFKLENRVSSPDFTYKLDSSTNQTEIKKNVLKILFLDLSQLFIKDSQQMLYDMVEEPLGLMYLLTHLNHQLGDKVQGRICKSRIDFDSYVELNDLIDSFQPGLICIRSLSFYKDFFHRTIALIRQWGIGVPIIAGGPYATSDYQFLLGDSNIDLVVLGEGEITLAEIVEKMLENGNKLPNENILSNIKGIAYVKKQDKELLNQQIRDIVFLDQASQFLQQYPENNLKNVNTPDDLLYLISTSGSTGIPKSVMLEHQNLLNLLHDQIRQTNIDFHRVLQFASIGFDVSSQEIFSALLSGGQLFLVDKDKKKNADYLLDMIEKQSISTLFLPPAYLKYIFSVPEYRKKFPAGVKHIITAGEQLIISNSLKKYLSKNPLSLHNQYGPSETHVVTSFSIIPGDNIPELPPIGKPISNTRIYILDENMNPKPISATGELYIAGNNVGRGYYNRDHLTRKRFLDDPFVSGERMYRSGDLAKWLPNGNIEFIGRVDQQVKIRGNRVEPGEIERHLKELDFIDEGIVVVRVEEKTREKYICAYFVSKEPVDQSFLRETLAKDLPLYMLPSYFVQLEKMSLTLNGKIDIKSLPLPKIEDMRCYIPPANEREDKLLGIWSHVLDIEKNAISTDGNFFELGGHSLKAVLLVAQIHKAFDANITLEELFKNPTIKELAPYLKNCNEKKYSPIEPSEKKEYYPLSPAQKRIYIIQQMDKENTAYNNPKVLVLNGKINKIKIEYCFKEMINRHESLRTSFQMLNQQPVQLIHNEVEMDIQILKKGADPSHIPALIKELICPFDLTRVPLIRVALTELNDSSTLFFMDMHHIITDGTSMGVFIKEFMILYEGKNLTPLRLQYKDISHWQIDGLGKEILMTQEKYWLDQFKSDIPILHLPYDHRRPEKQSFVGDSEPFFLNPVLTTGLKSLALEGNFTMYMLLFAVFNVLLSKLSGQENEEIIIGTTIAGRSHTDLQEMIGIFVNALAIKTGPIGEKSFIQFLEESKASIVEAFQNQDYPFADLVEKLSLERELNRNPLFDVMFVLQNFKKSPIGTQKGTNRNLEIKAYPFDHQTSKFDLTLAAEEQEEQIFLTFEYCNELFKRETIQRFIRYFKSIITRVIKNSKKKIRDLEMISREEKYQLLHEFNETHRKYPLKKTIQHLIEDQEKIIPDGVSVVGPVNDCITYCELNEKSRQLAQLLEKNKVGSESILGVLGEPSTECIIGMLGILKSGNAYLPIDPALPEKRIQYMLEDSNVKILIAFGGNFDNKLDDIEEKETNIPGVVLKLIETNEISSLSPNRVLKAKSRKLTNDSMAYVIYTSGSTGNPKGVVINHQGFVNLVYYHAEIFNQDFRTHMSQVASMSFDAMAFEVWPCLSWGATLYIAENETRMDVKKLKDWLIGRGISISFQPTIMAEYLLREQWPVRGLMLKSLLTAGDRLTCYPPPGLPFSLYNLYGPTESTVWSTWTKVGCNQKSLELNYPSIGKPIGNHKVFILGTDGQLQVIGVTGELCISGKGLARGYLNNPDLTAEVFCVLFPEALFKKTAPGPCKNFSYKQKLLRGVQGGSPAAQGAYNVGPNALKKVINMKECSFVIGRPCHRQKSPPACRRLYRTGDLARWLDDGNIEFIGRMDHQVKIRGYRIELGEIESHLVAQKEITEVVVLARENLAGELQLCAYVVSQSRICGGELKNLLAESLPKYMIPMHIIQLDHFPLTTSGKINRKALPEPGERNDKKIASPRNEIEKQLVKLWREILSKDSINKSQGFDPLEIGINCNFFELGGHSLTVTIMASKIRDVLGVDIPVLQIFKTPTIKKLSGYIREKQRLVKEKQEYSLHPNNEILVLLGKNKNSKKNLFVVHDGTGEVEGYIELAKYTQSLFNCWGLRMRRLSNLTPLNIHIEDLAKKYLKEIKKVQPNGPYYLGGWSLGGTIAFEMARQLEGKGEPVGGLVLFETPPPRGNQLKEKVEFNLENELDFVRHFNMDQTLLNKLEKISEIELFWPAYLEYQKEQNLEAHQFRKMIDKYGLQILPNYEHLEIEELLYYLNTIRMLNRTQIIYQPRNKIKQKIYYFSAQMSFGIKKEDWRNYCEGPIQLVETPGDHITMLKEPHIQELAKKIIENSK